MQRFDICVGDSNITLSKKFVAFSLTDVYLALIKLTESDSI